MPTFDNLDGTRLAVCSAVGVSTSKRVASCSLVKQDPAQVVISLLQMFRMNYFGAFRKNHHVHLRWFHCLVRNCGKTACQLERVKAGALSRRIPCRRGFSRQLCIRNGTQHDAVCVDIPGPCTFRNYALCVRVCL